eukprot:TRINITY_DN13806_c0_g1_i1.p1 TRINITY_DN13806_c0_g1~~TRINITY_DN13806_c0_g1_i1.p1  ORF type:complete len:148 (-),score=9.74 TRINITY_DN13806_c0_g1_i1:91-534(-)
MLSFMIFVPFLIASLVIAGVRITARFGFMTDCQLRYSPRHVIGGKPYKFIPRGQSWNSLFTGWLIGSDPDVDILDGSQNPKQPTEKRPFFIFMVHSYCWNGFWNLYDAVHLLQLGTTTRRRQSGHLLLQRPLLSPNFIMGHSMEQFD